jgi:hypothetical protein
MPNTFNLCFACFGIFTNQAVEGHLESVGQKRLFLSMRATPPRINRLAKAKAPGKTFAVLAGFCHCEV